MPIKSFRGKIGAGITNVQTISLHTNDGSIGYRIKKFELIAEKPATTDFKHVVKIYKVPQSEVNGTIDFSDNTLLAVGFTKGDVEEYQAGYDNIIFDNETFNQDIYITAIEAKGNLECNYYIELEMVKLALDENTVATLKDIRNLERDSTVTLTWNNII